MKKTISFYEFTATFQKSDTYKNHFTYEGLKALFEYFEEYEESTDTDIEFDIVDICCDYTEYENLEEFHNEYNKEEYPDFDALEYYTQVIYTGNHQDIDSPFIIQTF